jgi:hypothetical protein
MPSQRELIDDARRALGLKPSAPGEFIPHSARSSITGTRVSVPKGKGTAGIASPLTEGIDASTGEPARSYYGTQLKTSSDGLFTLPIKPIKTLNLTDANGAVVVIQLAEPKASA